MNIKKEWRNSMKYTISEKRVLKKLGISDFRHMTKDKIVKFASMLPYMDKEVALKALEQFPEYKDMSCQLADTYKQILSDILASNNKTVDASISACNKILDSLAKTLEKDDLTPDVIKSTQENMVKVAELMRDIDKQNKGFLLKIAGFGFLALAFVGGIAGALLGSNTQIHNDDLLEDNYNDNPPNTNKDNIIDVECEDIDADE